MVERITVHQLLQPDINGTEKHDCRKHYSVQLHDILQTALRSLCHGQEDNQRFHARFMAYLIILKNLNLNLSRNKELNIVPSNVADNSVSYVCICLTQLYMGFIRTSLMQIVLCCFYYTICSTCFGCNTHPSSGAI